MTAFEGVENLSLQIVTINFPLSKGEGKVDYNSLPPPALRAPPLSKRYLIVLFGTVPWRGVK